MTATDDPTALWAEAQVTALADGIDDWAVPEYGSLEWLRLPTADRRRAASLIEAAELHRRHVAEEQRLHHLAETDPIAWYREVTAGAYTAARAAAARIASQPTHAELTAARAKNQPAHEVRASEGWPAVAIPGRPGWRRHLINGHQVDKPNNAQEQAA